MLQIQKISLSVILKWLLITVIIGIVIGWVRYWIGYYILIQGILVGLLLPWMIVKIAQNQKESLANIRFKMAILLLFTFMRICEES